MYRRDLKAAVMLFLTICLSEPISAQQTKTRLNHLNQAQINRPSSNLFFVQLGAFREQKNAYKLKTRWQALVHFPVSVKYDGAFYRVSMGPMAKRDASRFKYMQQSNQQMRPVVHKTSWPVLGEKNMNLPASANVSPLRSQRRSSGGMMTEANLPLERNIHRQKKSVRSPSMLLKKNSWYLGLDLGILKSNTKSVMMVNNGSLYDDPEDFDRYSLNGPKPILIAAEAGRSWQQERYWLPKYSLGLRYQHLFTNTIDGNVTQYSLPSKVNYNYTWSVSSDVLSAYTKLDLVTLGPIMPYVNVGLGMSFNRSGAYSEYAASDVTPRVSPDYAGGTQSNFAYDVGLGIDASIRPNIVLSLGYDYQQLGILSSGPGQTTWSGGRLNAGTLNTNTLLVGLTYLFDTYSQSQPKAVKLPHHIVERVYTAQ